MVFRFLGLRLYSQRTLSLLQISISEMHISLFYNTLVNFCPILTKLTSIEKY